MLAPAEKTLGEAPGTRGESSPPRAIVKGRFRIALK